MLMNSEWGLRCAFCNSLTLGPLTVHMAGKHADEHGRRLTECYPNAYLICDCPDCRRATPYPGFFNRGWKVEWADNTTWEWCYEHKRNAPIIRETWGEPR